MTHRLRNIADRRPTSKVTARTETPTQLRRKRFDEAPFIAEGRFAHDELVTDGKDVYRITTAGVVSHEDAAVCQHGARKARPPAEWTATLVLRQAIRRVLERGTHELHTSSAKTRAGGKKQKLGKTPQRMPRVGPIELHWIDHRLDSAARTPAESLTVHGEYLRAVRRVDQLKPIAAWIHNPTLAQMVKTAAATAPRPCLIREAKIRARAQGLSERQG